MSRRRLDISSLLCDDDDDSNTTPELVVLAPHLKRFDHPSHQPRLPPLASQHRSRSNTVNYPPQEHQSTFAGLEALVHAATEERRRLSGGDLQQLQPQPQPQPPLSLSQSSQSRDIRLSPQFHRTSWQDDNNPYPRQLPSPHHAKHIDDILRSPGPSSPYLQRQQYDDDQRLHQMRQYQLLEQQQKRAHDFHDLDRLHRVQEAERLQRIQEAERLRIQEAERLHAQRERQKIEEERQKLEEERLRLLEVERRIQEARAHEFDRQERLRVDAERQRKEEERREVERREREIAAIREAERRELQRREREAELRDLERKRHEEHQRYIEMQQRAEFERQRNQEIERRIQQQQQQQRELETQSRPYEPPARIEIPPGPQVTSRKSDQNKPQSPSVPPPSFTDPRPAKKRRYSESPVDDKERIAREREKMSVGELGYGRIESPVAGPSVLTRRPGSGHGTRRPVAVSDLLIADKPPTDNARGMSKDRDANVHRVLSPLGRRSPPGSQIGRAKAARKSDDQVLSLNGLASSSSSSSHTEPVKKPLIIKEEQTKRFRIDDLHSTQAASEDARAVKKGSKDLRDQKVNQSHKVHEQQEDAHEWFLEHYAELPTTTSSAPSKPVPAPRRTRSPSASISVPRHQTRSPLLQVKKQTPSPITMPDAATSLEEELEQLLAEVKVPTKGELDVPMDVDSAVAELVGETLDGDDNKAGEEEEEEEDTGLGVDVEDELLSLIDDKPPPPSSARRASGSSSTVTVSLGSMAPIPTRPPPLWTSVAESKNAILSAPLPALVSPSVGPSTIHPPERGSMPPPTSINMAKKEKDKEDITGKKERESAVSAPTKKKKESVAKKSKLTPSTLTGPSVPPVKSRSKTATKSKKGTAAAQDLATPAPSPITLITKASVSAPGPVALVRKQVSTSRSRSASVMPGATPTAGGPPGLKAEKQEEEEDSDAANDDDKLYCVCKTKYDQERFMIACDRCDEWYHMQCVDMPELLADLVDQFFCPPCIEKNPELNLHTTYKQRCLYGLKHHDPSSPKACHKPARGAFSKYCSDECGVKYMQSRIDSWAKKGGKKDKLWESVKTTDQREGVVVHVQHPDTVSLVNGCIKMEVDCKQEDVDVKPLLKPAKPIKSKVEREMERLTGLLDQVVKLREEIKKGMEIIVWREKLLHLASERAEIMGQCGWDQRLCFGDEEWEDYGQGVLESYEEMGLKTEGDMEVEDQGVDGEGEWWCPGGAPCNRHLGWQTVRYKDVCKEKEKKEEALSKLTTREREIRKRLEEIMNPHKRSNTAINNNSNNNSNMKSTSSHTPLTSANAKLANGHAKSKSTGGDALKKGKKRKAPS